MEQKKMLTFFFEKKLMPMEPWRRSREDLTTDEAWAETLGRQKNKERSGPVWKNSCATKPISPAGVTLNICTSPPQKKNLRSWHMFADIAPPFERLIYRNCPDLKECMACIGPLI